jgi:hypothetical protein
MQPSTILGTDDLVRLPGRTISRQSNGILQLSCSFACKTSLAAGFRPLFEKGSLVPQDEAFKIQDDFSETTRGDGFTEFSVTATGQDSSSGAFGRADLKPQDNISVQNFPSGLVRVEQTFICETEKSGILISTLSAGNILPSSREIADEELYIYPQPSIVRRNDGYTEIKVTAYGNKRINPSVIERSSVKSSYPQTRQVAGGDSIERTIRSINDIFIIKTVERSDLGPSSVLSAPAIESPGVYSLGGRQLKAGTSSQGKFTQDNTEYESLNIISISLILDSFTSAYFGYWTEYTVVYKAEASDLLLLRIINPPEPLVPN